MIKFREVSSNSPFRVPWPARRSSQSILKEISPEYSLEGLMLKLKLQYLGHLMWRTDSLKKTLMLRKIKGRRRKGWQRMRWLDGITIKLDGHEFEQDPGVGDGKGSLACWGPWGSQRVRHDQATELNWSSNRWAVYKLLPYLGWGGFRKLSSMFTSKSKF